MSVVAEDGPKYIGHRECDPFVAPVRQCRPAFAQPLHVRTIATARTCTRFACVVNDEFPIIPGVNLCTQFRGLAPQDLAKGATNSGRSLIPIPIRGCLNQYLFERMSVSHGSFNSS